MNTRLPFSWLNSAEKEARPVASKITIKQFYLPDGSSTQVRGVPSDIALPSVNEFLPIGEDDLPHALPWGEIEEVEWVIDWQKLRVNSANEPKLVDALAKRSEERRENLEEFDFLKKQIEWRRKRFEEKTVSLHLAQRIQRKINEQSYIEDLDEIYDTLSENDYPKEEVLLQVVEKQNAISEKNLAEPIISPGGTERDEAPEVASNDEEAEEDGRGFDIYLRETARVMADWVSLVKPRGMTASARGVSEPH